LEFGVIDAVDRDHLPEALRWESALKTAWIGCVEFLASQANGDGVDVPEIGANFEMEFWWKSGDIRT